MAAFTLTAKQRSFADNIIAGMDPSEALRASEYKTDGWSPKMISVEAQKQLNKPSIALAIEEGRAKVQARIIDATSFTREEALRMAIEDRDKARELGQSGAAVSATRLACDIAGHIVDRKHITHEDKSLVGRLTADQRDQLRAAIAGILERDSGGSGRDGREGPPEPLQALH